MNLGFPRKKYRSHIRVTGLIHPAEICANMKIPFFACAHDSKECLELLDMYRPTLGMVSGARMLSGEVISKFKKGIINFHPGLIPEARGLDTAHWCIYDQVPLGVTCHFIDKRVDYLTIRNTIECDVVIAPARNDCAIGTNGHRVHPI